MIGTRIKEAIELKNTILNNQLILKQIDEVIAIMLKALENGHGIFFCGNGGSAADAQHLSAELAGRFYIDRPPLKAEAIHINSSFLTAVSNDYSFEQAYARAVEAQAQKGDVLYFLSTSGNSANIVSACQQANEMGITTIAFTGEKDSNLKQYANVTIQIPSSNTPRIQEAHMLLGHIICEFVEEEIFGKK
ncbi:SIS domain-containing protein [Prolixibacteraceae bacterium JC049]|nr:SIS domain-containing protein [Prolixibacteraceae bacterium JC049]